MRRRVEHFGGVQNIFKTSLTALEATGMQTVSAQSLGTGQSMESAHNELGRVAAAGVSLVCMDDSTYPAQLETDLRSTPGSLCARECGCDHPTRGRGRRHPPSHALRTGDGRALGVRPRRPRAGHFSSRARGVDAAAPIVAPSTPEGKRGRFSALEWTLFIPRKTPGSRSRCWPWAAP